MKIQIPSHVQEIIDTLEKHGYEAFAVGGCVRDVILNRSPEDWDITTSAEPEQIKKLFARTVDTGIEHGTVTVMMDKCGYEVTTYRIDGEYEDGRHPRQVEFTRSLEEDLKRRDFTINAMAYNDRQGLIDLFSGKEDLEKKRIRCVGEPDERFSEDALRILRAVRFSAQLGFEVEERTENSIKKLAGTLEKISAERIQAEIVKLLVSESPETWGQVWSSGISHVIIPELDREMEEGCGYILACLKNIPAQKALRLTMLLHKIGEKTAEKILKRLKFDNDTIRKVSVLTAWQDRDITESPAAVRKVLSIIGTDRFADLMLVKKGILKAKQGNEQEIKQICKVEKLYYDVLDAGDCFSLDMMKLSGKDLIEAGIKPGKEMGKILKKLLNAVLENPMLNEKDKLLEYLYEYMEQEKA